MKNCEQGRSMIEMLGVLAIVGILSVGGIAGYSKAMMKVKNDRLVAQMSELVMNIRNSFLQQKTYKNITNKLLIDIGAVPKDMYDPLQSASNGEITHALGGKTYIFPSTNVSDKELAFEIFAVGLDKYSCIALVTMDWGQDPSSGFQGLYVGTDEITGPKLGNVNSPLDGDPENGIYTPGQHEDSVPLTVVNAELACSCGHYECVVGLKYI